MHRRGFTVIEFLIVVAIMGILMAIVLASINISQAKARDNARLGDIKTIALALEQFKDACREYPYELDENDDAGGNCSFTFGQFIQTIPVPAISGSYMYVGLEGSTGRCTGYHLLVDLERENGALASDADYDSSGSAQTCMVGAGGEDGDESSSHPNRYDIVRLP